MRLQTVVNYIDFFYLFKYKIKDERFEEIY